ncbi:MAG: 4-(cytidine 5'-diphospho)-2-C-methyl-D-erythritol kinase [Oscillospiraceae bacterium]
MWKTVEVVAPAKINFHLDVVDKRKDGYHNLKMIMQTVSLADRLLIERTFEREIIITSDCDKMPLGKENIVYRAVLEFYSKYMQKFTGIKIHIEKNIPMKAGLGGGSSDAAAVLLGLNALNQTDLSIETIKDMGLKLGADVPFMIEGGTSIVEGIGEKIQEIMPIPKCYILIVKPNIEVSTAEAFAKIDKAEIINRPDIDMAIDCLEKRNLVKFSKTFCNVFEAVNDELEIGKIKNSMLELGAINSSMTGSGPSVFGVFAEEEKALKAAQNLRKIYDNVFVTKPVENGAYVIL